MDPGDVMELLRLSWNAVKGAERYHSRRDIINSPKSLDHFLNCLRISAKTTWNNHMITSSWYFCRRC